MRVEIVGSLLAVLEDKGRVVIIFRGLQFPFTHKLAYLKSAFRISRGVIPVFLVLFVYLPQRALPVLGSRCLGMLGGDH